MWRIRFISGTGQHGKRLPRRARPAALLVRLGRPEIPSTYLDPNWRNLRGRQRGMYGYWRDCNGWRLRSGLNMNG